MRCAARLYECRTNMPKWTSSTPRLCLMRLAGGDGGTAARGAVSQQMRRHGFIRSPATYTNAAATSRAVSLSSPHSGAQRNFALHPRHYSTMADKLYIAETPAEVKNAKVRWPRLSPPRHWSMTVLTSRARAFI